MCTCVGAVVPQSYVYTAVLSGVLGTGSLGEEKELSDLFVLLTQQSYFFETRIRLPPW